MQVELRGNMTWQVLLMVRLENNFNDQSDTNEDKSSD